jgi:hypothetical protein
MPPSYERINYAVRPAKNVERKMLVEALRRLSEFGPLPRYRYVGLGSTFFSDFSLFHKALGITKMVSIEKDVQNSRRFKFNRPFVCIKLAFGHSNDVLPALTLGSKAIVWLDYDSRLRASVLTDINHFCTHAVGGSVLLVTVNAHPDGANQDRVRLLQEHIGELKIPADVTTPGLAQWGTAAVYQRIINNEILERINERNGGLAEDKKLRYRQLFHFRYSDGARMLTVGGIVYETRQQSIFNKCSFARQIPFIREGADPYVIEAPNLTFRELHYLDSKLPTGSAVAESFIPPEDRARYSRIYRYFPRFAETEI